MVETREYIVQEIDPESHQIREVYAQYGLVMYISQSIERLLPVLLVAVYREPKPRTRSEFDSMLSQYERATFGALVRELRNAGAPTALLDDLSNAVEKRNWLAHQYFWQRAGHFVTAPGKHHMLDELGQLREKFQTVSDQVSAMSAAHLLSKGLTMEYIKAQEPEIINQALQDMAMSRTKT